MAYNGYEGGAALDSRPRRMVLRLGGAVRLAGISSIPDRWRVRASQLNGRLGVIVLQPTTSFAWCRLSEGLNGQIWPPSLKRVEARVIPLNDQQPATPTPPFIDLYPQMILECHEGHVGKLYGVVIETATGIVTELVMRVPGRLGDQIPGPTDPLAALLVVEGQRVLVPPSWAKEPETSRTLLGTTRCLKLDASAAQVSRCLVLRDDAELVQEVYAILSKNPALETFMSGVRVSVIDGAVTLAGPPLSPRLRASVEQDVWHIPGVLNVRNQLG